MAEPTHSLRFYFLPGGRPEPLAAVDPSSPSTRVYLIQTGVGENTQLGIGLSGSREQHIHAALQRDGMPNLVRTPASGPGNTSSARLGL